MKLERSNIKFPLWRKKVDSSILEGSMTPIPCFLWEQWSIEEHFQNSRGSANDDGKVEIVFGKKKFKGSVYFTKKRQCRLVFDRVLGDQLKETFVMSYMRNIEERLRKNKPQYNEQKIEEEIPFWEFLDIEFDSTNKVFYFNAHYVQKPTYLELFKEIVNSHILCDIEEVLDSKEGLRIIKEKWQPRTKLKSQFDAKNVIYNLIDVNNKQFYIGEADSLIKRLSGDRKEIPNWTHYRFDSLPNGLTRQQRVAIERLMIRSFASFLPNLKMVDSMSVSDYTLVNKKIDN